MLQIMTNDSIRINAGDMASFQVPIYENFNKQQRKTFTGVSVKVVYKSSDRFDVNINTNNWYQSQRAPGIYTFIYESGFWTYSNARISLAQYDLYVEDSNVNNGDSFSVEYTKGDATGLLPHGSFIKFNIVNINQCPESFPILSKQIYTDGTIITTRYQGCNQIPFEKVTSDINTVSSEGNFQVLLDSDDTRGMGCNRLMYYITVNYMQNGQVVKSQVCNKHYLYIIDDSYDGRMWTLGKSAVDGAINAFQPQSIDADDIQAVSYGKQQSLDEEQQKRARDNISATGADQIQTMLSEITLDDIQQDDKIRIIFNGNS